MPTNNPKERAKKALQKARNQEYKWRSIAKETGISAPVLCNILKSDYAFSDKVAHQIIDGCKKLKRSA